jgi:hypothetical protein
MLNEIERVLIPDGFLYIADLRRSFLGLFEPEIRSGLTIAEARKMFDQSEIRRGDFTSDLVWWKFEAKR